MLRYHYTEGNEFGIRLRQARKAAGLTLQKCADLLNEKYGMTINKGSISKYENGVHEPGAGMIHCLCEILGVSRSFLLGKEEVVKYDAVKEQENIIQYRVYDESMIPKYQPQDLLIISTQYKNINDYKDGMFCLLITPENKAVIRKLTKNDHNWTFEAVNKGYSPIVVPIYDKADVRSLSGFSIRGIVVEMRRKELFGETDEN